MNIYHYVLKTQKQKECINLLEYENNLQKIFKDFFNEDLISATIEKDGYILDLKTNFSIGDKRSLGKKVVSESGLGHFVKVYIYNGNKERSGQLFKIKE